MRFLTALFYFLPLALFAESHTFTDRYSSMSWSVPEGYFFCEERSQCDPEEGSWWYQFLDEHQSILTIEIEKYERSKDLTKHFHHPLKDDDEKIVFEGLEFQHFQVGSIEMSKCKVRALIAGDIHSDPLYICDYFFVRNGYGVSIGLMKKDDELYDDQKTERLMLDLLHSIQFVTQLIPSSP